MQFAGRQLTSCLRNSFYIVDHYSCIVYSFLGLGKTVVSQIKGPQYRPQSTIVLVIGSSNTVPLILGNTEIKLNAVFKLARSCGADSGHGFWKLSLQKVSSK